MSTRINLFAVFLGLTAAISNGYASFGDELPKGNIEEFIKPWNFSFNICEPNGDVVQKQIANNPVYLHGFDILHKRGINGKGTTIAFLEEGVNPNHPMFNPTQVKIVDCTQYNETIGENKAVYRNNIDLDFSRFKIVPRDRKDSINNHGTHVMGVAFVQKKKYSYTSEHRFTSDMPRGAIETVEIEYKSNEKTLYTVNHPGGCCPEANGILYSYSMMKNSWYRKDGGHPSPYGTSIFSICQLENLKLATNTSCEFLEQSPSEYFAQISPPLTSLEKKFVEETPIDQSPVKAILEALKGPAFAINWSSRPISLMDPKNEYKVPMKTLNQLGDLADKHDKIIIFCANNDLNCLEEIGFTEFYKQILNHPILSQRVIFAVNVCPTTTEDKKKLGELSINDQRIPFKLFYSSNYPGESLKNIFLSAVGSNIISGNSIGSACGLNRGSGTSEAAPVITSLATLVKQQFPQMSGPQVIKRIKDTALPLGDPRFTGLGYIWAPGALGL